MEKVDNIVEEVKMLWDKRSQVGIKKYGTTLEENLNDNYIQHALEEGMDQLLYLKALGNQLKQLCHNHPNDNDLGAIIRSIYGH